MTGSKKPLPKSKTIRRTLYGRRKGRPLRAGRQRLIEDLLPLVAIPGGAIGDRRPTDGPDGPDELEEKDLVVDSPGLDPRVYFAGPSPISGAETPAPRDEIWLEVGFGAGEHLAAQAEAHPEIGFIGCEPFINGVATLLTQIDCRRLSNIRIFTDDARMLIDRLADGALGRVFILFPDPWYKARHARRRFIADDTLGALARVMSDGAELRVATDNMVFLRWALAALIKHEDFDWCAEKAEDWRVRPADQPATRYEEKARAKGVSSAFLIFRRRARPT